eukprot:9366739-Karenia_brevis.AAC.1
MPQKGKSKGNKGKGKGEKGKGKGTNINDLGYANQTWQYAWQNPLGQLGMGGIPMLCHLVDEQSPKEGKGNH